MSNNQSSAQRINPMTNEPLPSINFGDIARDTISGFQGVVTSKITTINGGERYQLSAAYTDAKGNPRANTFDIRQLEIVRAALDQQHQT